uniref:Protein disulfideisomerase putative n=1 Tax=Albugo laibachii Nc14 TaxID=890382 RepID=F0VZ41_9STRA|nr:protein disulfideisomerase putative [Albugo laibachii Nc14]|eukprot:CCA14056.1 protein disulfideisomerase putative [Albugo laibachii Nc14]
MERMISKILFCILLNFVSIDGKQSTIVTLDNDNFEKLTQASTGATTGDWLIEFYAPCCDHCKRLLPIFEEVATKLKGTINVAKVDAIANRELGVRFGISGYPTIIFFRQGVMYKYKQERSKEALSQFTKEGYKQVEGVKVPSSPTMLNKILQISQDVYADAEKLLVAKKRAVLTIFSSGILLGLVLGILCTMCFTCRDAIQPSKEKMT